MLVRLVALLQKVTSNLCVVYYLHLNNYLGVNVPRKVQCYALII
jgi:hypothetical protein